MKAPVITSDFCLFNDISKLCFPTHVCKKCLFTFVRKRRISSVATFARWHKENKFGFFLICLFSYSLSRSWRVMSFVRNVYLFNYVLKHFPHQTVYTSLKIHRVILLAKLFLISTCDEENSPHTVDKISIQQRWKQHIMEQRTENFGSRKFISVNCRVVVEFRFVTEYVLQLRFETLFLYVPCTSSLNSQLILNQLLSTVNVKMDSANKRFNRI